MSDTRSSINLGVRRLGDLRDSVREVCGDKVADRLNRLRGINEEGEVSGPYRELGLPGLWYMMGMPNRIRFSPVCASNYRETGSLQLCRFHSKHVALRKCRHLLFGTPSSHVTNRNQSQRRESTLRALQNYKGVTDLNRRGGVECWRHFYYCVDSRRYESKANLTMSLHLRETNCVSFIPHAAIGSHIASSTRGWF